MDGLEVGEAFSFSAHYKLDRGFFETSYYYAKASWPLLAKAADPRLSLMNGVP